MVWLSFVYSRNSHDRCQFRQNFGWRLTFRNQNRINDPKRYLSIYSFINKLINFSPSWTFLISWTTHPLVFANPAFPTGSFPGPNRCGSAAVGQAHSQSYPKSASKLITHFDPCAQRLWLHGSENFFKSLGLIWNKNIELFLESRVDFADLLMRKLIGFIIY